MPVIVFSSPKGGCGKTTAATLLATELAQKGASVTVIDADPNRNVADWVKLPGAPEGLTVISDVTEETIVDQIETASAKAAFVIVDLAGIAPAATRSSTSRSRPRRWRSSPRSPTGRNGSWPRRWSMRSMRWRRLWPGAGRTVSGRLLAVVLA